MLHAGRSPTPTFSITQASGKQCRIDNDKKGGQMGVNQLHRANAHGILCPASTLFNHLRQMGAYMRCIPWKGISHSIQTGIEYFPDAYRSFFVSPSPLRHTVSCVFVGGRIGELLFQLSIAMVFGFAFAVINLASWSAFAEGVLRRIGRLLWSMYVDDGCLVDLVKAGVSGQQLARVLWEAIGSPVAPKETKLMSSSNPFLQV